MNSLFKLKMPKYNRKHTLSYYDQLSEEKGEKLEQIECIKHIQLEVDELDFDLMVLDCFNDIKEYMENKIIFFGNNFNSEHLHDFILNNM